jgi:hypothetical protein
MRDALDALLGWTALLGPLPAVLVVGALSGAAVMLLQKRLSRQRLLALCRADLRRLKELLRTAEGEERRRLRALRGRIGARTLLASLPPALASVPLIGLVAWWADGRIGVELVREGDAVGIVAYFEDGATGFAHVVPNEGLAVDGPAVAAVASTAEPIGRHARWRILALRTGTFPLSIRHDGELYEAPIDVGGLPPERVTVFSTESPTQDRLQAIEIRLAPAVPTAWWNLWLGWAGVYLAAALAVALACRRLFRVQ